MAVKSGKRATPSPEATVAHVMEILASIEEQCRIARLMLRRLDPKTPIALTREVKALAKKAVRQPMVPEVC